MKRLLHRLPLPGYLRVPRWWVMNGFGVALSTVANADRWGWLGALLVALLMCALGTMAGLVIIAWISRDQLRAWDEMKRTGQPRVTRRM